MENSLQNKLPNDYPTKTQASIVLDTFFSKYPYEQTRKQKRKQRVIGNEKKNYKYKGNGGFDGKSKISKKNIKGKKKTEKQKINGLRQKSECKCRTVQREAFSFSRSAFIT